jgi:hypothetical protein
MNGENLPEQEVFTPKACSVIVLAALDDTLSSPGYEEAKSLLIQKVALLIPDLEPENYETEAEQALEGIQAALKFCMELVLETQSDLHHALVEPTERGDVDMVTNLVRVYAQHTTDGLPEYMLRFDLQNWMEQWVGKLNTTYADHLIRVDWSQETNELGAVFLTLLGSQTDHLDTETQTHLQQLMNKIRDHYISYQPTVRKFVNDRGWQTLIDTLDRSTKRFIDDEQGKDSSKSDEKILREIAQDPYLNRHLLNLFGKEFAERFS